MMISIANNEFLCNLIHSLRAKIEVFSKMVDKPPILTHILQKLLCHKNASHHPTGIFPSIKKVTHFHVPLQSTKTNYLITVYYLI